MASHHPGLLLVGNLGSHSPMPNHQVHRQGRLAAPTLGWRWAGAAAVVGSRSGCHGRFFVWVSETLVVVDSVCEVRWRESIAADFNSAFACGSGLRRAPMLFLQPTAQCYPAKMTGRQSFPGTCGGAASYPLPALCGVHTGLRYGMCGDAIRSVVACTGRGKGEGGFVVRKLVQVPNSRGLSATKERLQASAP